MGGYRTLGQKWHSEQAVAAGQVFGICFLPLFITVILKGACVRDQCPIGPEMLEYFSSPPGPCDSFIHRQSGMHGEGRGVVERELSVHRSGALRVGHVGKRRTAARA